MAGKHQGASLIQMCQNDKSTKYSNEHKTDKLLSYHINLLLDQF